MELKNLIEVHLDIARLSKDLDELGHPGRLWAVRQWTRANMTTLWDAAKGFRPRTLDDLVPPSLPPLVEVIHHGKNSLPAFSAFQKRFCRPSDAQHAGTLLGYNSQWYGTFSGPGYFVARPSTDAGELVLDYTVAPNERPPAWPEVLPNSARLGRFIYGGMRDALRSVSSHVSIGRVSKNEGYQNVWFVLVREDPQLAS